MKHVMHVLHGYWNQAKFPIHIEFPKFPIHKEFPKFPIHKELHKELHNLESLIIESLPPKKKN